jgi:hypothetical protein
MKKLLLTLLLTGFAGITTSSYAAERQSRNAVEPTQLATYPTIVPVDGKSYTIPLMTTQTPAFIVGKSTKDNTGKYWSVPFTCAITTTYASTNGVMFSVGGNLLRSNIIAIAHQGIISKINVPSDTHWLGRNLPYVFFKNQGCASLWDGDQCISELKKKDGSPLINITCNYTS